ncbi:unnamed protein product [Eruca vesicaria subsp. sativa]|uniref:Uncharacterized protein n=1 Tax=Eruca vesicaria subsp. sativa TaxID=29727 RepID=A0ABC8LCA9_ERUVS|nr:unnamed protein product [Eruca vesicaria subsp. sativa]
MNRTGAKHGVNGRSSKRFYWSEYSSGQQIKQQEISTSSSIPPTADKSKTGVPSPRLATRRYKLLKDVMC